MVYVGALDQAKVFGVMRLVLLYGVNYWFIIASYFGNEEYDSSFYENNGYSVTTEFLYCLALSIILITSIKRCSSI